MKNLNRTPEEQKIAKNIASKKYQAKNKEKVKATKKKYHEANKDKMKAQKKGYRESKILNYYIVYGLPNAMYCGITNQPEARMRNHKKDSNDTEGYFIISIHTTKKEALQAENEQHKLGWLGSVNPYPAQEIFKNTLVSVITGDTTIESKT